MYKKYLKRLLDIIISIVILPIIVILIIIISPFIVADDGLPIFYNAKRIGKNGKLFKMYKFRSMKNNAPDIRLADGSTYNGQDDPRVTKVGKFLRSTSLDEFPQFLNVLKGDMSLIGPRPDPEDWLEKYPEDVKIFLTVRPGITGYSQAYYRNSASAELKMKNDVFYAKNCSFMLDLKIIVKTTLSVLGHKNLYKDTSEENISINRMERVEKKFDED